MRTTSWPDSTASMVQPARSPGMLDTMHSTPAPALLPRPPEVTYSCTGSFLPEGVCTHTPGSISVSDVSNMSSRSVWRVSDTGFVLSASTLTLTGVDTLADVAFVSTL